MNVRVLGARIAAVFATLGLTVGGVLFSGPAAAASPLPSDPAAHGYIGLCDEAGRNVIGGSTLTRPLAWTAVASEQPPAAYQGQGENAVLGIYQPRPDTQPAMWSGLFLTAATFYSTPKAPVAQETYEDPSVADVMKQYPPLVNGFYVLRMHFGKQNYGTYDQTYPATTIQVQGSHWRVVQGGTVDCKAAKGVSLAQITGVVTKRNLTPHKPSAEYVVANGGGAAGPYAINRAPSNLGDAAAPTKVGNAAQAAEPATGTHSGRSSKAWIAWLAVGGLAALIGTVAALGRLRARPAGDRS